MLVYYLICETKYERKFYITGALRVREGHNKQKRDSVKVTQEEKKGVVK